MKGSSQALNKKHASSFSTQAVHAKAPKKPLEPLTRAFFSQLLKSETEFYNKQYSVETLDELIQLYAKAVEYYDTIKDEIASYFIFKIQDALATKKSLKLLVEESLKTSFKRSTLSSPDPVSSKNDTPLNTTAGKSILDEINVANEVIAENAAEESDGEDDGEDDVAVKEFSKKRKEFMEKRNKKVAPSFSTLKAQKQRFVNFYHKMELEKQKDPNKLNMHSLLDDFGSSAKDNDKQVLSDISKQRNRLKDLINERKQRSMAAYTMSAISFNNINHSTTNFDGYGKRFEEVLKDLDDAEESVDGTSLANLGGTRIIDSDIGKVKSSEETTGLSINLEKSKVEEFITDTKTLELSPIVDRSKRNLEAGGVMKYMQPSVPGVEMSLEDNTVEKTGEEEVFALDGIQEKENKDPLNES